jgi:hypothetical protein
LHQWDSLMETVSFTELLSAFIMLHGKAHRRQKSWIVFCAQTLNFSTYSLRNII